MRAAPFAERSYFREALGLAMMNVVVELAVCPDGTNRDIGSRDVSVGRFRSGVVSETYG